jgi:hypothetical protein
MLLTDHEKTDIGRLILLKTIQRRLLQDDAQAAEDVRKALDEVDTADWVSCLRWSCILAAQVNGEVSA